MSETFYLRPLSLLIRTIWEFAPVMLYASPGITSLLLIAVIGLLGLSAYLLIHHYRYRKLVDQLITTHELKAYRAQLDPHILQNTFEIMAAHIANEAPDTAISFIHNVSSYLRQVLYSSDKSTVTLEKELEFTEKYLSVQKSITSNLFEYSISVDDEVDTYGIEIPSMLFQPILENSIKHGFANTSRKDGHISLNIKQQDIYLICTISDNGAGCKQPSLSSTHISKGLQLTEKRLYLLFKHFKHRPQIEINSNETRGVSTIIRIPIL